MQLMNKIYIFLTTLAILASALFMPSTSYSYTSDKLIDGAKLCTRHFPRQEKKYGIPMHLLAAIATTESGRYHKKLKMPLPWPWTINAEGKGFYLKNKKDAIRKIEQLKAQGIQSIDVGCMQINLIHHAKAFRNLSEALDPDHNIGYAAKFLRKNYNSSKSWLKAAANYHSKTPSKGRKYLKKVENSWNIIVKRIKQAKINVGNRSSHKNVHKTHKVISLKDNGISNRSAMNKLYGNKAATRIKSIKKLDRVRNAIIIVRPTEIKKKAAIVVANSSSLKKKPAKKPKVTRVKSIFID